MAPRSPPWESQYSHLASASYLADLRHNRPTRPSGSRPLPAKPLPTPDENAPPRAGSAFSFRTQTMSRFDGGGVSKEQKLTHRASMPTSDSFGSLHSEKGRPLVFSPHNGPPSIQRKVSPPLATLPDTPYEESSLRVKEREEAHALRAGLEKIDRADNEQRIHDAAKMEAADLVWKHRNPKAAEVEKTAAYRNPDLDKQKYGELGHAKKPSAPAPADSIPASRSASGESTASTESRRPRLPWLRKRQKVEPLAALTPAPKAALEHESILPKSVRKTSEKRHVSSGSSKGVFKNQQDEIYEEAEEMPTITESPSKRELPLRSIETNIRGSRPLLEKSMTDSQPCKLGQNRLALWRNDPNQTRNETHMSNRALPKTPAKKEQESVEEAEVEIDGESKYKDGYEVRGDDIRAATSMRKSDRSPNLPTPTAVSDRLGRPIVSFDPKWKPASDSPRTSQDLERPRKEDGSVSYPIKPTPQVPEITIMEDQRSPALQREAAEQDRSALNSSTVVPSISISNSKVPKSAALRPLPQISLPEDDYPSHNIPVIDVSEPQSDALNPSRPLPQVTLQSDFGVESPVPAISVNVEHSTSRPLPAIHVSGKATRPLPSHTQSSPSKLPNTRPTKVDMASRVPWLSRTPTSASTSSVACTACALPISGRIVTASGSATKTQKARFHPECFTCHHCSTGLEAVAFYPEPDDARLERCQVMMPQLDSEHEQMQEWVKSNEDLHFFCHLDYHELFSPRCHNCKTPIEGAVVLALGRHYHQDHFFCAECGDPFSSESPFVEHNNYPYCVSCHTKRTSARCRACKQPILNEMTVEALGGKWHDACFVCCECQGDFGDEGRFFVREIEVELTEKQKRKKLGPIIEEKAACQSCEERRVKNINIFL